MEREWQRLLLLTASAIAGMAALGCAVVAGEMMRGGWLVDLRALAFGAVLGAVVGFSTLPWMIAWLWDTRLHRSLPFVYGMALLVTLAWAIVAPDGMALSAAMPAVVCTVAAAAFSQRRFHDPARDPPKEPRCPDCDYDLTGLTEPGCPECGWRRSAARRG